MTDVTSVNGQTPDVSGNVSLSTSHIPGSWGAISVLSVSASPWSYTATQTGQIVVDSAAGAGLPSALSITRGVATVNLLSLISGHTVPLVTAVLYAGDVLNMSYGSGAPKVTFIPQ